MAEWLGDLSELHCPTRGRAREVRPLALSPVPKMTAEIDRYSAIAYFLDRGWLPIHAFAIVSLLHEVSGLNSLAQDDRGGFGVMLWSKAAQETYREIYGKQIVPSKSSPREQLAFFHWQLTSEDYRNDPALKKAGDALRETKTVQEAGTVLVKATAKPFGRASVFGANVPVQAGTWYQEAQASAMERH